MEPRRARDLLARAQELAYPRGTTPILPSQTITRRIVRRIARTVGRKRTRFNIAAVDALAALLSQLEDIAGSLELLRSHVRLMDENQRQLAMSVNHELVNLRPALAEIARERSEDRAELTSLLAHLRAARSDDSTSDAPAAYEVDMHPVLLDGFYAGFETRFRGERASIREQVASYLSDVEFLVDGTQRVLDIGPGRCEWLELLRDRGIPAYGVDSNQSFVQSAVQQGLHVQLGDAVTHLRSVPDKSLGAITAFHVIEHLPFEIVVDLIDHALRALQPGGVLILETPNPRNLTVGAAEFWLDPTHIRPLHPQLLEYLVINRGFDRVGVRMLHPGQSPYPEVLDTEHEYGVLLRPIVEDLNRLFYGAMDYAVLGHTPAP